VSRRLEFEERAAVLEFDGGLSRAEAERRAVADTYDELVGRGCRARGILGELIRADAQRRAPALEHALQALGLVGVRAPLWGFGHVVAEGGLWRPVCEGEPGMAAVIVPASEEGRVVDLVAQILADGRMLARLGLVDLLGLDTLETVRNNGDPLLVFGDVLDWLRGHGRGVVMLDWRHAHRYLDGLAELLCSERTAPSLHRATRRCRPTPTIATPRRGEAGLAA
jgi:hypothetical protein